MPDDPEATSWTDLRASFDFTPAEEQEIAERADVLLAASEAQGWEARSCAGGGEVTVPNTFAAQILALFRETYSGMPFYSERHLGNCPAARVVKYEMVDEADFQFTAIITCGHIRPMGFSRGPKEASDG